MARRSVLLYSDGAVFSGAERYLLELARGLPRDRFELDLVCSEEGALDPFEAEAREMGLAVRRLPAIPTLAARGPFLKVLRYFATQRHDILHFNLTDPRACNGAMTAAKMALRSRFVVTEHLPMSVFDDKPLPLRHRFASRNTAVTIVNTEGYRELVEKRPHHRGAVVVIPNGLRDPGKPTPERRNRARATLELAEHGGPLIGWVGRIAPQKDPDLFVEGIRRVHSQRPDCRFVIVGDGPDLGGMEARVTELNLAGVVKFYGHRQDVLDLLPGLDLLVNTSRYEGMPLSIIEANAAAVPAVVTDIPGMRDLVAPDASGWIVAQQDGDALGTGILDALEDRDRLQEIGRVARERALTLFTLESMCARTAEAYDSLF